MTSEEALIYLPFSEEDELEDVYDEKLFESKHFFLNRFPISKIIHARARKMDLMHEAFLTLGGESTKNESPEKSTFPTFVIVREAMQWYQAERNALKLRINHATSFPELKAILFELLEVTRHYAAHWNQFPSNEEDGITVSKELDPMEILHALNDFEAEGGATFTDLFQLKSENRLKTEGKRLSLWLNLESDE